MKYLAVVWGATANRNGNLDSLMSIDCLLFIIKLVALVRSLSSIALDSQNGIPEWNPRMESQNGFPEWIPRMDSQNGFPGFSLIAEGAHRCSKCAGVDFCMDKKIVINEFGS